MSNTQKNANLRLISALIFIYSLFIGGVTMAQNVKSEVQAEIKEKTQLEKEVEIAKQKKELAEAQKAEAEALKAAAEAKLPSTETKGLSGTVTINQGAGYYAEILAYEAMNDCAEEIAKKVKDKLGSQNDTLIIIGQTDLTEQAALYSLLKLKIDDANKVLDKTLETYTKQPKPQMQPRPERIGVLAAAPTILGAASDIAAFFKTDRTITSRTITLNEQALLSAVANKIYTTNEKLKIILPKLNFAGNGVLFTNIQKLMDKRSQLMKIKEDSIAKFDSDIMAKANELTRLKTKKNAQNKIIDTAIADNKPTDDLIEKLEEIDSRIDILSVPERDRIALITSIDKVIVIVDDLIKTITEKSPDKLSPLERVTVIEQINGIPDAKLLYLLTVSQGGEVETSKSPFTQGRISYIGGAVISYILTEKDGTYLYSGNVSNIQNKTFKRKNGIN